MDAAAPDLGALPAARELAVEVHRQLQLVPDQRRGGERLGTRGAPSRVVEVHDRRHVDRAHVRVRARVPGQVDAGERLARPVHERPRELALRRGQGEHAPLVVGIGVRVEQPGGRERGADRGDRVVVAPLAHVGHGHQDRLSRLQRARLRSSAG